METEEKVDEWELLPPNTSFLDFGLEDIKDLFSKEIDYMDYFIEQTPQHLSTTQSENEKPLQQARANKIQIYDEKSVQEIDAEDPKQSDLKDDSRVDKGEEDLADKTPSDRRRPLAAGISDLLSIGAAVAAALVCGFLLGGSGRRQEQVHRADTMRFHTFKDEKALKQMVRQANRINQVLVVTANGMPPPVMQPATISFGGCFDDML